MRGFSLVQAGEGENLQAKQSQAKLKNEMVYQTSLFAGGPGAGGIADAGAGGGYTNSREP